MNKLHWIFTRFMSPEGDDGSSNGGAPAPAPETDDGDSGVDWEALNEDVQQGADEGGGSDDSGVPDEPPAEAFSKPVEDAPKPAVTTPEAKPAEPVTPVPEQPVAKTPEQEAAEQADLSKRFAEWQASETARLVKEYQFDEDTAARLQTEPEVVLPELAAKMQLNMTQAIVEIVQRMMPSMVQPELKRTSREAEASTFFSTHNPDLDLAKHSEAILEAGKAFRKLNPKATPEQAAKGIGQIVRTALGLSAPETPPPAKGKGAPHRPPVAGGRTAPAAKPAEGDNKWASLVDDD